MKFSFLKIIGISTLLSLCFSIQSQDLYITGGHYFDTETGEMVANQGIIVKSGKFVGVNTNQGNTRGFERIRLKDGQFILPGIFDVHAHYRVTFNNIRKDEVEVNPIIFLANGVTSTFPNGEIEPEKMMETRKAINRGEKIGARIHNSGPYFGTAFPGWDPNTSVEEINKRVDKWAELGVAGFKAKGINPTQLEALIKRAHKHGLTVTGHLGSGFKNTVNPKTAIEMGIDRIEHFLGGDVLPNKQSAYATLQNLDPNHPKLDKQIDLFISNNVFFDATLTAYGYYGHREEFYDYWHDERKYLTNYAEETTQKIRQKLDMFQKIFDVKKVTVKRYFDRGGKITLGTDHPSVGEYLAGFSAHREMEALSSIGIPNADVIRIATINGARALRLGDKLGSIKAGKLADFFIVNGNPLEDIKNTRNIYRVIKGGEIYDPVALLKSVEGKMGPKNELDWK